MGEVGGRSVGSSASFAKTHHRKYTAEHFARPLGSVVAERPPLARGSVGQACHPDFFARAGFSPCDSDLMGVLTPHDHHHYLLLHPRAHLSGSSTTPVGAAATPPSILLDHSGRCNGHSESFLPAILARGRPSRWAPFEDAPGAGKSITRARAAIGLRYLGAQGGRPASISMARKH